MNKVYLVGRGGVHGNKEIFIENEIIIGRDASICQLVYPSSEKTISSVHCKVQYLNGQVLVTDMGSTNGTFLDTGVRLAPHTPQALQSGQGFYLGDKTNAFAIRVQEDYDADAYSKPASSGKGFSITSMILGILSIVLLFNSFLSIACGVVGLVFGSLALVKRKPARGMALTGFICSIVGIAITLVIIILGIMGLAALSSLF